MKQVLTLLALVVKIIIIRGWKKKMQEKGEAEVEKKRVSLASTS